MTQSLILDTWPNILYRKLQSTSVCLSIHMPIVASIKTFTDKTRLVVSTGFNYPSSQPIPLVRKMFHAYIFFIKKATLQ